MTDYELKEFKRYTEIDLITNPSLAMFLKNGFFDLAGVEGVKEIRQEMDGLLLVWTFWK